MKLILSLVVMFFSLSAFSASLKIEGNCSGKYADGKPVAFKYYSDFNGCKDVSKAGISYAQGRAESMVTGSRSFTETSDIYKFGQTRLVFANSTGNTSGKYKYTDKRGERQSVTVQCEVRDYHYSDC